MSDIGEMPPEIGEQHPLPPEKKKQKIGGGGAEDQSGVDKGSIDTKSSDDKQANKLDGGTEEEEDDSEDDSSLEWVIDSPITDPMKPFENLPERLKNIVRNSLTEPDLDPDPDIDYCPDGTSEVNWDVWNQYYKEIRETEGFGVKTYPGSCPNAYMAPLPFFKKYDVYNKLMTELSNLAISDFNNRDSPAKEFKLVDVDWVVTRAARGIMYYLTFTAEDPKEGVKTFEAKVLDGIEAREVALCRVKK